ncbi:hypothetical protein DFS34DRAFT_357202 [Phlyctochytrium arcticum]|nr:hypothetical protein DFS34DRAFT_357202 [Phlyctochytrium arcticum]
MTDAILAPLNDPDDHSDTSSLCPSDNKGSQTIRKALSRAEDSDSETDDDSESSSGSSSSSSMSSGADDFDGISDLDFTDVEDQDEDPSGEQSDGSQQDTGDDLDAALADKSIIWDHGHFQQAKFGSLNEAYCALQEATRPQGFLVKKGKEYAGKKGGHWRKVACLRAHVLKSRVKENDRKRETSSRLCGCEWTALINKGTDGSYTITTTGDHNHTAFEDPSVFREGRVLTADQEVTLKKLLMSDTATADIFDTMRTQFGDDFVLTDKDIDNKKQTLRIAELAGLSEMDALLRELQKDGAMHQIRLDD